MIHPERRRENLKKKEEMDKRSLQPDWENEMQTINLEHATPKYLSPCIICGKTIDEYDYSIPAFPQVCDECKEAVAFAKWLRTGRTGHEREQTEQKED